MRVWGFAETRNPRVLPFPQSRQVRAPQGGASKTARSSTVRAQFEPSVRFIPVFEFTQQEIE